WSRKPRSEPSITGSTPPLAPARGALEGGVAPPMRLIGELQRSVRNGRMIRMRVNVGHAPCPRKEAVHEGRSREIPLARKRHALGGALGSGECRSVLSTKCY